MVHSAYDLFGCCRKHKKKLWIVHTCTCCAWAKYEATNAADERNISTLYHSQFLPLGKPARVTHIHADIFFIIVYYLLLFGWCLLIVVVVVVVDMCTMVKCWLPYRWNPFGKRDGSLLKRLCSVSNVCVQAR